MSKIQRELTLRDVLFGFFNHKNMIVTITLCVGVFGALLAIGFIVYDELHPEYIAEANFVITAKPAEGYYSEGEYIPDLDDLTLARNLIETANIITKSENMYLRVLPRLNNELSYQEYKKAVSLSQMGASQAVAVKVVLDDRQDTVILAIEITHTLPEALQDILDIGSVNIIDTPIDAQRASQNFYFMLIFIGLGCGFLLALGLSLIRTSIHPLVIEPSDAKHDLELDILAKVFRWPFRQKSKRLFIPAQKNLVWSAEHYGTLASIFIAWARRESIKSVMITSALAQEGKSTVALNLAISIALKGYRTLIIDCNARRPVIGKKLKLERYPDLTLNRAVYGEISLNDAIIEAMPGLNAIQIMPAANPLEINKLQTQLLALQDAFDYIILDTPPAGIFPDALNLAACSQACLFVMRQSYAHVQILSETLDYLRKAGCRVISGVLNDVRRSANPITHYQYNVRKKHSSKNTKKYRSRSAKEKSM